MTPQLWTQFQPFQDWRLTHPDLTYEEAVLLYKAELQLFQNYQDEIRNQTLNRQTQLTGDLLNLSADISTILTEGGVYSDRVRRYVLVSGNYGTQGTGLALNRGSGLGFVIREGDIFVFNFIGGLFDEDTAGTYKAITNIPNLTGISGNILDNYILLFLNELDLFNTNKFIKISDSTTINSNTDFLGNF